MTLFLTLNGLKRMNLLKCLIGDCKTSEVEAFTAEYLEKIVEPCDWQAIWHTGVFDVLVKVS